MSSIWYINIGMGYTASFSNRVSNFFNLSEERIVHFCKPHFCQNRIDWRVKGMKDKGRGKERKGEKEWK